MTVENYHLQPVDDDLHAALEFSYDTVTTEITGQDAAIVEARLAKNTVTAKPEPWHYTIEGRSKTELAAALGYWWVLPDGLMQHYPKPEPTELPSTTEEEGSVAIIGADQVIY